MCWKKNVMKTNNILMIILMVSLWKKTSVVYWEDLFSYLAWIFTIWDCQHQWLVCAFCEGNKVVYQMGDLCEYFRGPCRQRTLCTISWCKRCNTAWSLQFHKSTPHNLCPVVRILQWIISDFKKWTLFTVSSWLLRDFLILNIISNVMLAVP